MDSLAFAPRQRHQESNAGSCQRQNIDDGPAGGLRSGWYQSGSRIDDPQRQYSHSQGLSGEGGGNREIDKHLTTIAPPAAGQQHAVP